MRASAGDNGSESVSPIAATVPLTDEGRTTDGLTDDGQYPGPETTRVNRADLDALLQQTSTLPAQSSEQPPTRDLSNASASLGNETLPGGMPYPQPHGSQNFERNPASSGQLANSGYPGGSSNPNRSGNQSGNQSGNESDTLPSGFVTMAGTGYMPSARDAAGRDDEEEDLTIDASARLSTPPVFPATPQQVTRNNPAALVNVPTQTLQPTPAPDRPAPRSNSLWYVAAAGSLLLLLLVGVAVWLGLGYFRKPAPAPLTQTNMNAPDPAQQFDAKLAEAESLLAAGDLDAAIARLREATALDPSNVKAHRRLGDLLLDNGKRREAIEEFRAITRTDPGDAQAWRSLARAQLDESLYEDAVASYRQLVALGGDSALTDNETLSYAEALRLAGHAEEARPFYQKLTASTLADVASAARQHLSELTPTASPTPLASPEIARELRAQQQANQHQSQASLAPTPAAPAPTPAPTPAPAAPRTQPTPALALTASDHFSRGEQLWSSNRAAALNEFRAAAGQGNLDAYYYLGLGVVQGKDPAALQRAELGAAIQLFQNAQRGSRFRGEAKRYEDQLGREFDRRRQK